MRVLRPRPTPFHCWLRLFCRIYGGVMTSVMCWGPSGTGTGESRNGGEQHSRSLLQAAPVCRQAGQHVCSELQQACQAPADACMLAQSGPGGVVALHNSANLLPNADGICWCVAVPCVLCCPSVCAGLAVMTCMMMIATALWAALAVGAAATPPTLTTATALALVATLAGATTALAARTATAAMTMITSATHAGAGTGLGLTTGTTAGPTGGSGRQQGMVAALGASGAATAAGRWAMSLAAGLIGSATPPTGLGMERAGMEALSTGTCCHPHHPRGQVAAQQGLHRRSQPQLLRPWRQARVRQAGAMTVTATSTPSVRRLRQSWRASRLTWRG